MARLLRHIAPPLATLVLVLIAGCGSVPRTQYPDTGIPVVQTARALVGVPYHWGGESPQQGFDCSGLAWYAYRHVGIRLPRTARAQYRYLARVPRDQLVPGDLVFFSVAKGHGLHVGIYVGDGLFVHAPSAGKAVRYSSLSSPYWRAAFLGAGRLPAVSLPSTGSS
jgi:cell wall-associated NlpC family hydrolase